MGHPAAIAGCPLCKRKGEAMTNLQIQNPISELLQKRGQNREMGLYSCCSANEYVIRAALRRAKDRDTVVLVSEPERRLYRYDPGSVPGVSEPFS